MQNGLFLCSHVKTNTFCSLQMPCLGQICYKKHLFWVPWYFVMPQQWQINSETTKLKPNLRHTVAKTNLLCVILFLRNLNYSWCFWFLEALVCRSNWNILWASSTQKLLWRIYNISVHWTWQPIQRYSDESKKIKNVFAIDFYNWWYISEAHLAALN